MSPGLGTPGIGLSFLPGRYQFGHYVRQYGPEPQLLLHAYKVARMISEWPVLARWLLEDRLGLLPEDLRMQLPLQ